MEGRALMQTLLDHPAVRKHGSGVSSTELGNFILTLADTAATRVLGVGAEQYGGERQRFETLTQEQQISELIDELADAYAYLAMVAIKALAIKGTT